jgi:hypothetical protein
MAAVTAAASNMPAATTKIDAKTNCFTSTGTALALFEAGAIYGTW